MQVLGGAVEVAQPLASPQPPLGGGEGQEEGHFQAGLGLGLELGLGLGLGLLLELGLGLDEELSLGHGELDVQLEEQLHDEDTLTHALVMLRGRMVVVQLGLAR